MIHTTRTALVIVLVALALLPAQAQTPKRGGILNAMQGEDLPTGFSIHETSTTAVGVDDPGAIFYENYKCGSIRNYSEFCSPEIDHLIDQQSQEIDPKRRLALVHELQRRLEADAVKPMLGWRLGYFARSPHVQNLVPHDNNENYARMQAVWLDR